MVTDLWYGMPMDEVIKSQCDYEPTYMYQYNMKSWNDWVPKHLGKNLVRNIPNIRPMLEILSKFFLHKVNFMLISLLA